MNKTAAPCAVVCIYQTVPSSNREDTVVANAKTKKVLCWCEWQAKSAKATQMSMWIAQDTTESRVP